MGPRSGQLRAWKTQTSTCNVNPGLKRLVAFDGGVSPVSGDSSLLQRNSGTGLLIVGQHYQDHMWFLDPENRLQMRKLEPCCWCFGQPKTSYKPIEGSRAHCHEPTDSEKLRVEPPRRHRQLPPEARFSVSLPGDLWRFHSANSKRAATMIETIVLSVFVDR